MRPAPAVSFICTDGGAGRCAVAALTGLVAAVLLRWGWSWLLPSQTFAPLAALGVWAAIAVGVWRRTPPTPRVLRWDSQTWQLARADGGAARPGRVHVAIDLGPWMLLRFEPAHGHGVWLTVGAAAGGAARAALYAPTPLPGGLPAADQPGA